MHPTNLSDRDDAVSWTTVASVLVIAVLIRGGVLWVRSDWLAQDPDSYAMIAESLVNQGAYRRAERPTAYRPPLYPLLLTTAVARGRLDPARVAALHLLLGVMTALLTLELARRWQLGRAAWYAALLTICDPILLMQSTQVMTETLATLMALVGLLCLTWYDRHPAWPAAALSGAALGLATLCRPTFLLWLLLVALAILVARRGWRGRLVQLSAVLLAAGLVLAPWAMRNYLRWQRPIVTTTHGGYTLLLGNNPGFYRHLRRAPWGTVWDSRELDQRQLQQLVRQEFDEVAADRQAYREALGHIAQQPGMFVYASLVRIGRLWRLLPHQLQSPEPPSRRLLRYLVGAWYATLFLLAGAGAAVQGRRLLRGPWLWGVLLCLAITAAHTLYWSNLRMRAPLIPLLATLAAVALEPLTRRSCFRKSFS